MIKKILILSGLLVGQMGFAGEPSQLERNFKRAHAAYQTAINRYDRAQAKVHAETSFKLGCELYEKASDNCIALTIRYSKFTPDFEVAEKILRQLFEDVAEAYGEDSLQIGVLALSVIKNFPTNENQDVFDFITGFLIYRIEDVAGELERLNPQLAGEFWLEAVETLDSAGYRYRKEIKKAYRFLKENSPAENEKLINARYLAAKYYFHKGDSDKAIELHEENVKAMVSLAVESLNDLEIETRGLLVAAYQKEGLSNKAQSHLVGLSKISEWSVFADPIYRTWAKYPDFAWNNNQEGRVKLSFDLDDKGRPVNIKVIEADHGNTFKRAAIKALREWRFIPKFEDGKPVPATGLSTSISFAIGK